MKWRLSCYSAVSDVWCMLRDPWLNRRLWLLWLLLLDERYGWWNPWRGLLDAGFVFGAALMAVVWTVCDLIARRSAMGGMRQAAGLHWMWASPKLPLQQRDCSGC